MEILFVLIVIAVICNRSIRVVKPGRCLIIFQNGLPVKVVKSDATCLSLLLPFIQNSKAVDTCKRIANIPEFFDSIDKKTPLVQGSFEYRIVDPLKAVNNTRLNSDLDALIINCLQRLLVDATINQCLLQPALTEARVIEMAKLKSGTLGVSISAVKIKSFPRHRQLLIQVTTLPCVLYLQIAEEVQ